MVESSTILPLKEKLTQEQQISPSLDYPDGFVASLLLLAVLTVIIMALLVNSGFGGEASDSR
jgi:hypothetical protein